MIAHCAEAGIQYLCTPYDEPSVELLESIDVPAYKIGSTDTTNTPFLRLISRRRAARYCCPPDSARWDEVEAAVVALEPMRDRLAILHCTSEYPAALEDANLRAMKTLARAFAVPVGYSDHSAGVGVAPWAVAAGACILEKHFTLDRSLPGPDHRASVEPDELAELVRTIRLVERALGDGVKRVAEGERANRTAVRKSLVTRRAIAAGETIRREDLTCKRPRRRTGSGLVGSGGRAQGGGRPGGRRDLAAWRYQLDPRRRLAPTSPERFVAEQAAFARQFAANTIVVGT